MKIIYPITIILFLNLSTVSAIAQEGTTSISAMDVKKISNSEWQKTINDIKEETQSLLSENDKLKSEYEFLKENLSTLQESVNTTKEELSQQESEKRRLKDLHQERKHRTSSSTKTAEKIRNEISAIESQNAALKDELSDLKKSNQVWQDQVSELESQRRELALDLKMEDFYREEYEKEEGDEVKRLKAQLRQEEEKGEDLVKTLEELKSQKKNIPGEIENIKDENFALSDKITKYERDKISKMKVNKVLRQENQKKASQIDKVPAEILREKRKLQVEVAKLEKKLESIRTKVTDSTKVLDKKRSMMDEIMKMDSKNQELRGKISDMMKEIETIKEDISQLQK